MSRDSGAAQDRPFSAFRRGRRRAKIPPSTDLYRCTFPPDTKMLGNCATGDALWPALTKASAIKMREIYGLRGEGETPLSWVAEGGAEVTAKRTLTPP